MNDPKCPCCDGADIVSGVRLGITAEAGRIGLEYRTALILVGTEPLLADICSACGSVVRLRVRNTKRNWLRARDDDRNKAEESA
jgi:hypothetical protein